MPRTRIKGKHIKDDSLTGADVLEESLVSSKIPFFNPSFASTNIEAAIIEAATGVTPEVNKSTHLLSIFSCPDGIAIEEDEWETISTGYLEGSDSYPSGTVTSLIVVGKVDDIGDVVNLRLVDSSTGVVFCTIAITSDEATSVETIFLKPLQSFIFDIQSLASSGDGEIYQVLIKESI